MMMIIYYYYCYILSCMAVWEYEFRIQWFPLLSILCIYISFFYFRTCVCGCVVFLGIWWRVHTALKDSDEVLTKRARHVVTETQRTLEAAQALKRSDFKKVSACYVSKPYVPTSYTYIYINKIPTFSQLN